MVAVIAGVRVSVSVGVFVPFGQYVTYIEYKPVFESCNTGKAPGSAAKTVFLLAISPPEFSHAIDEPAPALNASQ
jgi:hypothetical protein